MCKSVQKFKKAFFDLPSREFGETYVESILREILNDDTHKDGNAYDAVRDGKRVEYKAVRVMYAPACKHDTLYERVMSNVYMSDRIGSLKDIEEGKIVANCQNIKLDDFDILDYVLVDNDGFHIFEITANDFKKFVAQKKFPNWSDKHGSKEGGKNGQFPIKSDNLEWHKTNFIKFVSWKDILTKAKKISLK